MEPDRPHQRRPALPQRCRRLRPRQDRPGCPHAHGGRSISWLQLCPAQRLWHPPPPAIHSRAWSMRNPSQILFNPLLRSYIRLSPLILPNPLFSFPIPVLWVYVLRLTFFCFLHFVFPSFAPLRARLFRGASLRESALCVESLLSRVK